MDRLADLRLERRVSGPAEDEDDSERGEGEEEDDHRRGRQRGRRRGSVTSRSRSTACPERRRGLAHARVESGPEGADDPDDDGDVEERVRDEDRRPALPEPVGEDGEEGERDDHRGQDERHQQTSARTSPLPGR